MKGKGSYHPTGNSGTFEGTHSLAMYFFFSYLALLKKKNYLKSIFILDKKMILKKLPYLEF